MYLFKFSIVRALILRLWSLSTFFLFLILIERSQRRKTVLTMSHWSFKEEIQMSDKFHRYVPNVQWKSKKEKHHQTFKLLKNLQHLAAQLALAGLSVYHLYALHPPWKRSSALPGRREARSLRDWITCDRNAVKEPCVSVQMKRNAGRRNDRRSKMGGGGGSGEFQWKIKPGSKGSEKGVSGC